MYRICCVVLILAMTMVTNILAQSPCVVCGCNNEICAKPCDTQFSTCLWKAEYECYQKFGICENNAKGECEWRRTPELMQCLELRQKQVEAADAFSD